MNRSKKSKGKSGAIFIKTLDSKYLIKTLQNNEADYLKNEIIPCL